MGMALGLVILPANVPTKRGLATTSLVLRLGVLIMDLSQTRPNALNASFIPKALPLYSRSPSLMVELYLLSKLSSILVYISPLTYLGLLISILSSQNALNCLILFPGSFLPTPSILNVSLQNTPLCGLPFEQMGTWS